MIKLSELFDALASGELSNLNMAEGGENIKQEKLPIVLRSINLGLLDLYTRFMLRKKTKEIETDIDQQMYRIDDDELIEILSIKDQNNNPVKSYLTDTRTIKLLSKPVEKTKLIVEYKAKHPKLTQDDIDLDTEIELPIAYYNALLYFIADRLFMSIPNKLDQDLQEGIRYKEKFFTEIEHLVRQGVDIDYLNDNSWFCDRGFV